MLVQVQSRAPNKDYEFSGSYFFIIIMLMDTQNSFAGQAPASAPEPQAFNNYDQPKKKSTAPIIIALVIAVLALGGTTVFLLLNNGNKDTASSSQEKKTSEEKESEISSDAVKKDLFEKMKYLLLASWDNGFISSTKAYATSGYDFPFELFKDGTYSDDMKQSVVSMALKHKLTRFNTSEKGKNYATKIFNSANDPNMKYTYSSASELINDTEYAGYVETGTFDKEYKSLFGEDVKTRKTSGVCGELIYESSINVYYTHSTASQCGGAAPDHVSFYIDSYMQKGNEAYIYVYGVDAMPASQSDTKTCRTRALSDADYTRDCTSDEAKIMNGDEAYSTSLINESNKENYTRYRFVFSGDNSDYHFVKVEKVEKK